MHNGTLAIAIVQRHVMIVQAARSHSRCDRWLDVYTFTPFGDRVFLTSSVPRARISSTDILAIFPHHVHATSKDMIELPGQAWNEFLELTARNQEKYESMWRGWSANLR
ncbi:hypothetical protein PILCRDRAFT_819747 [Piloderma croceum F 1598]|uniref:Uncharacterized protein n=1 Tax=Piloderma croceum (strain F 1598) TaxID=765440 RepID=A0A0C3FT74_PILCF|nr:hypothetical protein PILCRDRAFT_819747 [Piloderma croceum F 1598]